MRTQKAAVASLHAPIHKKPVNTDSIEALTPETDRMVSGSFVNVEYPGQPAKISCKYYKGMQYFNQVLEDGKRYTVPLSVARHINERCMASKHINILDAQGNPLKEDKATARYRFMVDYLAA